MYPEKYFLISDYQSMELLGVNGLFTNCRVDRNSLPEGFYKYSIRSGDDDFISSVKSAVFVNHMGDFICNQELDMKGEDELDLFGDYAFTDEKVDLNKFFGEDIQAKIAQEIDDFYYNFDTYEYRDSIPSGGSREDVFESIKAGLRDKEYVNSMISYFKEILDENEQGDALEPQEDQKIRSIIGVLTDINSRNRDSLDVIVEKAKNIKDVQVQGEQNKDLEVQQ